MGVTPYLFFNGQCEAAISFYRRVLGAELQFMQRYKDGPPGPDGKPFGAPDAVMHASLKIGDSVLLASDSDGQPVQHGGFAISVSARDVADGRRLFDALADGGQVTLPFDKTFWTEGFGMLTDRFGVPWMVNVEH